MRTLHTTTPFSHVPPPTAGHVSSSTEATLLKPRHFRNISTHSTTDPKYQFRAPQHFGKAQLSRKFFLSKQFDEVSENKKS